MQDDTRNGQTGTTRTGEYPTERDVADVQEDTAGAMREAREAVSATATKIKDRVEETADKARKTTAGGMESAAEKIRERADDQEGVQAKAGTTIADGMDKTANYLREHDTQTMVSDVESYIREHPAQALIGAVALGFVIGRVLR